MCRSSIYVYFITEARNIQTYPVTVLLLSSLSPVILAEPLPCHPERSEGSQFIEQISKQTTGRRIYSVVC